MYGLDYSAFEEAQRGYRNRSYAVLLKDGRRVNLIVYKREPGVVDRIRRAEAASRCLSDLGYPVRKLADSRISRLATGQREKFAALHNYLPGTTIAWEAYTAKRIKALGQMMSDFHAAWAGVQLELPDVTDELTALWERMNMYFADPHVVRAAADKLGLKIGPHVVGKYQQLLPAARRLSAKHALHMDFVRGNVLFEGDTITGVIDFEKAANGHPVFDVARTLAFLLVDCKYKTAPQVRKYFLYSGYHKRGQAKLPLPKLTSGGQKIELLDELVNFFLLHDLYKFMRHNVYEGLHQNEHYLRTVNLLVSRGVVLK